MISKGQSISLVLTASAAVFSVNAFSQASNTGSVLEFATKVTGCAAGDNPESALQGQVPAAMRAAGFRGFNCNLELIGQHKAEGGNWSSAVFHGNGRSCAYFSTSAPVANRQEPGVPVIDITDPANPVKTGSLATSAMLDPWESLRVNQARRMLYAGNGTNSRGGPDIDVYDLSDDCRAPQLLSSVPLTYQTGDPANPEKLMNGHEGNISPDGRTYYVGDLTNNKYHAVDLTNPTRPKIIATFDMADSPIAKRPHGLSVSQDGNRVYAVALYIPTVEQASDLNAPPQNGFLVLDTSEVQARMPNPKIKLVSAVAFKDGSVAQHTIITQIRGKPHLVMVDEGGSGGLADSDRSRLACSLGMAPFPMARIYDMSDEKAPKLVSKLGLETHDVKNCDTVIPDIAGLRIFTYGSHYCSVDNVHNATAMACSYFNSGIRVFDIRNPAQPKEIAYFNPPAQPNPGYGSAHFLRGQWREGGPDWCASRLDFDKKNGLLTTMCQDNGLMIMKFKNGVWPFKETLSGPDEEG